jgi:HAD superfamily hydrolase (TIGR01459 family)
VKNEFSDISSISHLFKGILLDAYGVFWAGNRVGLIPNADIAMKRLVLSGKIVGILSNTTQMVDEEIKKLQEHGLIQGQHFHFMITSGELTRRIFSAQEAPFPMPKKKFWLLNKDTNAKIPAYSIFASSSIKETSQVEEADFIYICPPKIFGEDQTDVSLFEEEVKNLIQYNIPMVCSNPDFFALIDTPPRLVIRQGSIAELYKKLGGKVFYIGKPHLFAFETAMKSFSEYAIDDPASVVMVGDTPETDIQGARNFGMKTALITKTGIFSQRPKNLLPEQTPDFYIERLFSN